MRTPTWVIVAGAAAIATVIAIAGALAFGGWTDAGIGAATRFTARWSFPWFLAAWTASSLATLWPGGWRTVLLRRRRAVGLGFAANHTVHFAALLTGILAFNREAALVTIVGGGTVYLFIALMALTSNDAAVRWMGPKRWRLLHAVGGWAILLVFTNSYVGRIGEKPWLGIPATALIAAAVLLRGLAWLKRHRTAQAA
jgi:sulfoxide reductase heme-binding subunit YedZ